MSDDLRDRIWRVILPWRSDPRRAAEAVAADIGPELERLRAHVAEYENTINWHTTCHGCAKILDSAYRETMRAETAEKTLAAVRAFAKELRTYCSPHGVAAVYADRLEAVLNEGADA